MSRFQFHRRNQQTGESISVFIQEPRLQFWNKLEAMIRDGLDCDENHQKIYNQEIHEDNTAKETKDEKAFINSLQNKVLKKFMVTSETTTNGNTFRSCT